MDANEPDSVVAASSAVVPVMPRFVLDNADSVNDGAERHVLDRVGRNLDGITQYTTVVNQTGHLGLCAAVPQLEVVQHRVVVFGETLVCVLDGGHIGAHLVGVVRHLDNGLICVPGRRGGVPPRP